MMIQCIAVYTGFTVGKLYKADLIDETDETARVSRDDNGHQREVLLKYFSEGDVCLTPFCNGTARQEFGFPLNMVGLEESY